LIATLALAGSAREETFRVLFSTPFQKEAAEAKKSLVFQSEISFVSTKIQKEIVMKTRSTFFSLLVMLALLVSLVFQVTPAYAASGIDEDFRNATAPNWTLQGTAALTAGGVDPAGDGWLRLTSNAGDQAGSAIYNNAFSNGVGIQVSFMYATYGGNGADGFTFYLIDGATGSPTVGAAGGALGYSWNHDNPIGPGVTNGYVGIGFDEFGNFTNSTANNYGTGGFAAGINANRIGIRGPGNLNDAGGFPYLTSVATTIATGSRAAAKHVVITITPAPTQKISVTVDDVAKITDYDISAYTMPSTFKMGFSASTGGSTNYHEIRDLTVTGLTPSTTAVVTSGTPSVLGNSVTFTATVSGATTPTGSVAFYDGTTYLGTGVLDGAGVATYATSALTAGTHTITAKYLGDSNYAISQGTVDQTVIVVPPPTITSIVPNSGPVAGGTTVVITGTNLTDGTVTFGGTAATCTVDSATQITCTTPAHTPGAVDVVVTTPGGTATSTGGFTYVPLPTITSIVPNSGPAAGGTTVVITGTDLTGGTVTFGGTSASCTVDSPTQITCTTPPHASGLVDVAVTTPGGTATSVGGFTYIPPPTITSIVPNSGPVAGGTTVVITGTNLTGGTVTFGGTAATCTVNSATQITCTTPAHTPGAVDVVVTTPGGTATSTGGFTYVPLPTVTGLSPRLGVVAGGTSVTITGTGFTGLGTGDATFTFGGVAATCTVNSDTSATCATPAGVAGGAVDVAATTPVGGTGTTTSPFYYVALNPVIGPTAGGQTVTITGVGFTGATVYFNGLYSARAACAATTDFLLTCITPARPVGPTDVVIATLADGNVFLLDGYTYAPAPSIDCCGKDGCSPNTGSPLGGETVLINGENLTGGTFTFGGVPAVCTVNSEGTQATCITPAHAPGLVDVVVTTVGGTATVGFTYGPYMYYFPLAFGR